MPLFTGASITAGSPTVGLSRVLFPVVLLLGLTGLFVGILQSYDQFTIPALAPAGLERRDRRPAGRPAAAFHGDDAALRLRDRRAGGDGRCSS